VFIIQIILFTEDLNKQLARLLYLLFN
jgi:hypothetical protein